MSRNRKAAPRTTPGIETVIAMYSSWWEALVAATTAEEAHSVCNRWSLAIHRFEEQLGDEEREMLRAKKVHEDAWSSADYSVLTGEQIVGLDRFCGVTSP